MPATEFQDIRQVARQVTHQAGSNFTCAMLFLSPPQREALEAVYAFTRHTDDLVDDPQYEDGRTQRLAAWRKELTRALEGEQRLQGEYISERDEAILRCYAQVARTFGLRREPAFGVIDGCEMDLNRTRYADFDELRVYCYRVASCVGLLCLPIFGAPEATEYADNLGVALQLTNILRDVGVDIAHDRLYLPREEMRRYGVSEEQLRAGRMTEGLKGLLAHQAERAEDFYRAAEAARPRALARRLLSPQLMRHIYHRILVRMRGRGYDPFTEELRISKFCKAWLAIRTWLRGW